MTRYLDPNTGAETPLETPSWRGESGAPLLLTERAGLRPRDIDTAAPGIWRYREAFAVDVSTPISLGEGRTPLIAAPWVGGEALFKLEWFSPSGSFKDRGASVMLSTLREQGVTSVLEDSSGNGGAAVACYGAAGGMSVTVFAPDSTSPAKLVQARAFGATVELVPGPRDASQHAAIAAAEAGRGFYASHAWQPFFLEGTKTLAYELWEDLGFEAPDAVIVPVGAGTSLLGLAIGFRELARAGSIAREPRLYAVQPLHCSPIDAAARGEAREVFHTAAEGTAIAAPARLAQVLSAVGATGGGTLAVTEDEIVRAHGELAARGLYAEPTSAVAAAALTKLRDEGTIGAADRVAVVLTGSGLKATPRIADFLSVG